MIRLPSTVFGMTAELPAAAAQRNDCIQAHRRRRQISRNRPAFRNNVQVGSQQQPAQHNKNITLTVVSGEAWINELAFFDTAGNLLHVTVNDASAAALVDEQNCVPEYPSYMTGMYFDELYHARTAYEHLHNLSVYEVSHPPLGK